MSMLGPFNDTEEEIKQIALKLSLIGDRVYVIAHEESDDPDYPMISGLITYFFTHALMHGLECFKDGRTKVVGAAFDGEWLDPDGVWARRDWIQSLCG